MRWKAKEKEEEETTRRNDPKACYVLAASLRLTAFLFNEVGWLRAEETDLTPSMFRASHRHYYNAVFGSILYEGVHSIGILR